MPFPVDAVSFRRVVLGLSVGVLGAVLVGAGLYSPTPAVAGATALLSVVLAAQGLLPFGDTVAYHVLQGATFALWGLALFVGGQLGLVSGAVTAVGLLGTLNYGVRALREGPWTTVN
ncbi:MAG: hypothetical protein ABEJ28_09060 [Salinigranum sp.]